MLADCRPVTLLALPFKRSVLTQALPGSFHSCFFALLALRFTRSVLTEALPGSFHACFFALLAPRFKDSVQCTQALPGSFHACFFALLAPVQPFTVFFAFGPGHTISEEGMRVNAAEGKKERKAEKQRGSLSAKQRREGGRGAPKFSSHLVYGLYLGLALTCAIRFWA